jgi:hypothetical protein
MSLVSLPTSNGWKIPLTQVKSSPEQKASDYLKETLGDALTKILTERTEKRLADTLLNNNLVTLSL